MTGNTAKLYTSVINNIEGNIFKLKPAKFITDFEAPMRKAIRECYPNVNLHGCWYHYCAAIRRNVVRLRIYDLVKSNWNARKIYKKLMSWPLLPSNKIIEGFEIIEQEIHSAGIYREFKPFLVYFKGYWLKMVYFNYSSIHPSVHPFIIFIQTFHFL